MRCSWRSVLLLTLHRLRVFPPREPLDRRPELPLPIEREDEDPAVARRRSPCPGRRGRGPARAKERGCRMRRRLRPARAARGPSASVPTSLQPASSGTARTPGSSPSRRSRSRCREAPRSRRRAPVRSVPSRRPRRRLAATPRAAGEEPRRTENEHAGVPEVPAGSRVLPRAGRVRFLGEAHDGAVPDLEVAEVGLGAAGRDRQDDDVRSVGERRRFRQRASAAPRRRSPSGRRARRPRPDLRPPRNGGPPPGSRAPSCGAPAPRRILSGATPGSSRRTRSAWRAAAATQTSEESGARRA